MDESRKGLLGDEETLQYDQEDLSLKPSKSKEAAAKDKQIANFFEEIRQEELIKIWPNISQETRDRLLDTVSQRVREDLEEKVQSQLDIRDDHQKLFDKLKDEYYESAQLVPVLQKKIDQTDGIQDPDPKRSDLVTIDVMKRPAKFECIDIDFETDDDK